MKNRDVWLYTGVWAIIALFYLYPYFATFATIGYSDIPPLFDSDLYLYMNFSLLPISPEGTITSPWYGDTINAAAWAYRKFDLSFIVFRAISTLCGGDLTLTMIVWTLFWVSVIFVAALWLFREIAGRERRFLIVFGLLFLFLMRVPELSSIVKMWLSLPTIDEKIVVNLTFSRAFFPQASVVFLFLYIYFLIKVLKESKFSLWAVLAVVQFLALKTFPYLLMILAFATFLAIVFVFFTQREKLKISHVLFYALLCGVLDLGYLILTGQTESAGMKTAIIDVDFSRLKYFFKGSMILAIILTAAIAFLKPKSSYESKIAVLSLGLSYIAMTLSHAFFSPALQIENHIYYFASAIFAIEIFYLLAQIDSYLTVSEKIKKAVGYAAIIFILIEGALASQSHYKRYYAENSINYEVYNELKKIGCDKDTLIITPTFVPSLISPISFALKCKAEILYHPDAHFLSSKERGKDPHKIRQAIYYYLMGKDEEWIRDVWDPKTDWRVQYDLVIPALRLYLRDKNRERFLREKEEEMEFYYKTYVEDEGALHKFFGKYKKIVVVDFKKDPFFKEDRLDSVMKMRSKEQTDRMNFYVMEPR
ncbi:MAG: hypothetical protein GXO31_00670 [Epsilonproteobacteria bacterium]|nr:hypothetical protein [Campylobacterota bacterium]